MLLEVINEPNPILKEHAAKVSKITPAIIELAHNMAETMYRYKGVGLAAPQVANSLQMIIFDDSSERNNPRVLINPTIVSHSQQQESAIEGCLSCKGVEAEVERWQAVTVKGKDLDWKTRTIKASGFLARILQHEIDHLQGITISNSGRILSPEEMDEDDSPAIT